MQILMELAEEERVTLVVVTHDNELSKTGDRVLEIRDGKIHSS